jgi:hypothetical protein
MVSLISYSKNVYILSLLFFLKTFYAYTQSNKNFSVYFAISLEDCINCIQPIKEFNKIPKDFSPQIVMKENDKRVAKYFFQENMNLSIMPYKKTQIVMSHTFTSLGMQKLLSQ